MPSKDPAQRFEDILRNIGQIERFTAGMELKSFSADQQAVYAVKYALLVISEAAVKLGRTAEDLRPDVQWREIRSLGNRLRHDYESIDVARIWLVLQRDLPGLNAACEDALRSLTQGNSGRQ